MDWRQRAACRGEDPELFFPAGDTRSAQEQMEAAAKAVCARCAVIDTCLTWSLQTGQDTGVWGGMSEADRRTLRRPSVRVRRTLRRPSAQVRRSA
ncbi:WhiB family transcriptional regulator [Georgenia sp. TF02-10]|uniref:WhiB family transcriptional regulator n=1 Tax=Georgenia sp. TF02-10 TaxID=2917725 RepID=UPI001FA6B27D|nr:WhiB family transcriptional regulator [Georgenia sp. TF02-10]UNX54401.1 WhiB family transcriptional regulator [Georgenia sp. TF02-10]